MALICGIVTAAIFQLIFGLGFTGFSIYFYITIIGVVDDNSVILYSTALPGLWMSLLAFSATTLIAGIIGCVAGCQRGQCVVLTYMASCILCCLASCEAVIMSALNVVIYCTIGECTKILYGIFSIVVLASSTFMFLVSLLGSGFACRARCFCCESDGGNNRIPNDPNVMILTSPSAPPENMLKY